MHHLGNEVGQMVIPRPLLEGCWQQQLLVGVVGKVGLAHRRLCCFDARPIIPSIPRQPLFSDRLPGVDRRHNDADDNRRRPSDPQGRAHDSAAPLAVANIAGPGFVVRVSNPHLDVVLAASVDADRFIDGHDLAQTVMCVARWPPRGPPAAVLPVIRQCLPAGRTVRWRCNGFGLRPVRLIDPGQTGRQIILPVQAGTETSLDSCTRL